MIEFVGSSGYALWWPKSLFVDELEGLSSRGTDSCFDREWVDEVELFLRQAFTSRVVADDFRRVFDGWDPTDSGPNPCVLWLSDLAVSARRNTLTPHYAASIGCLPPRAVKHCFHQQ